MQAFTDAIAEAWEEKARATLEHPGPYMEGVTFEADGDDVLITFRGGRTVVREFGVGPGGFGDSGPFDIRLNVLRSAKAKRTASGRAYQSIPGAGGFFSVSESSAPIIHPGVVGSDILALVIADLPAILAKAIGGEHERSA